MTRSPILCTHSFLGVPKHILSPLLVLTLVLSQLMSAQAQQRTRTATKEKPVVKTTSPAKPVKVEGVGSSTQTKTRDRDKAPKSSTKSVTPVGAIRPLEQEPQQPFSLPPPTVKTPRPETDQATGALRYVVGFTLPPGRNNLEPELSLIYNSQNTGEESILGAGWELALPSISRSNKTGTNNLYAANYLTSSISGELVSTSATTYRAKVDTGDFLIYTRSGSGCTATDKKGIQYEFGNTPFSRQADPSDGSKVYRWFISEVRDKNDNFVKYEYFAHMGQVYPSRLSYTGHGTTDGPFEVELSYEPRPDVQKSYRSGFEVVTEKRISAISIKVDGDRVRQYAFAYSTGSNGRRSLLQSITESGWDEAGAIVTLPAVAFEYQMSPVGGAFTRVNDATLPAHLPRCIVTDVNGDGLSDILYGYEPFRESPVLTAYLNNGTGGWVVSSAYAPPVPFYRSDGIGEVDLGVRAVDVNGDGLTDLLESSRFRRNTWLNTGSGWQLVGSGWNQSGSAWLSDLEFANGDGTLGQTNFATFADINGDGLVDILRAYANSANPGDINSFVLLNNGINGWIRDSNWVIPVDLRWGTNIVDLNADGLADILQSHHDHNAVERKQAYLSNGRNGWVAEPSFAPPIVFYTTYPGSIPNDLAVRVFDVNGDGLPDILKHQGGPGAPPPVTYLNTGSGWLEASNDWDSWESFGENNSNQDTAVRTADINGDGMTDLIRAYLGSGPINSTIIKNIKLRPDLQVRITYPQGGFTEVSYQTTPQFTGSGGMLNPQLPLVLDAVRYMITGDGSGISGTTSYTYEGGRFYFGSATDRRFAGFSKAKAIAPNGSVTETYFHQGNGSDTANGEYEDHPSKIGRPYLVNLSDTSGKLYTRTLTKVEKADLGVGATFVFVGQRLERSFEGAIVSRDRASQSTYSNTTGALLTQIEYGEVTGQNNGTFTDIGTDRITTTNTYVTTPGLEQLISQETLTNQSGVKLKESRSYYDGQALGLASRGNKTQIHRWLDTSRYVITAMTYNLYGNVSSETDGAGNRTSYTLDALNLYPSVSSNALGHTTSLTYNYAIGRPKRITDPNGLSQEFIFDGLGRLREERIPDHLSASPQSSALVVRTKYLYADISGAFSVRKTEYLNAQLTADTFIYIDGLGRNVQIRRQTDQPNQYAVSDIQYNPAGSVSRQSLPYFSTGSERTAPTLITNLFTTSSYDPLDRVISETTIVGTASNVFSPWVVLRTDAAGSRTRLHRDAHNRLVKVEELSGSNVYTTSYVFDVSGNLTTITDAVGNLRNFEYNGLSLRIRAEDLHAAGDQSFGVYTFSYDQAGRLATTTDPDGITVRRTFDQLNRITSAFNQASATSDKFSFRYDTCALGKGRLCETEVGSNGQNKMTYAYNALGLRAQEVTLIDSQSFTTKHAYARNGQETRLTNPDDSQVEYSYNSFGLLETIGRKESGDAQFTPVIKSIDYSPSGQARLLVYANDTQTENIFDQNELYRLRTKRTATPSTSPFSLMPSTAQSGTPPIIQQISYTYDPVGNLKQLEQSDGTVLRKTQLFTYDQLHRLTSVVVTNAAGSPAAYSELFTYSPIGNLLTKTDHSGSSVLYSYNGHLGTAFANPHAATAINGVSNNYDKRGNLIAAGNTTYTYNWDGRLTAVKAGKVSESYAYDVNGQRTKRAIGKTITRYASLWYNVVGSKPTKHIMAENAMVCALVGSGSTVTPSYLHADHLSGASVSTDSRGRVLELTDYFAFGALRISTSATVAAVEQRKFAGHDYDTETGLSYMNARYYEGSRGRFLSQDPVFLAIGNGGLIKQLTQQELPLILTDPQNLHSYAYARNNPLVYIDPTGQFSFNPIGFLPERTQVAIGNWANNTAANNRPFDYVSGEKWVAYTLGGIGLAAGAAAGVLAGGTALGATTLAQIGSTCVFACGPLSRTDYATAMNWVSTRFGANASSLPTRSEVNAVMNKWVNITMPDKASSILYHFNKHADGKSLNALTQNGMNVWNSYINNSSLVRNVENILLRNDMNGIKIELANGAGGIFSKSGGIITTWFK